jgi:hypothetical protein
VESAAWPKAAGFPSIHGRWKQNIPVFTRWATAPTPALRRSACSPKAPHAAVASALIAKLRNSGEATKYNGFGTCYIEFGGGRVGKVEVDFYSGPKPTGIYFEPSIALRAAKEYFGSSRRGALVWDLGSKILIGGLESRM